MKKSKHVNKRSNIGNAGLRIRITKFGFGSGSYQESKSYKKIFFFVKALTLHQTLKDFLNIENVKKNIMHQCLNNFLLKCSAQTNGGRIRILIRGII